MADGNHGGTEIKETDIVFNCPHCGKSLAIDYKGAGLMIPCTDCGQQISVPIPDGMELSDLDSSKEEQELRMLNLRRSLDSAENRIATLEAELNRVRAERDIVRRTSTDEMFQSAEVLEKIGIMQKAVKELQQALDALSRKYESGS